MNRFFKSLSTVLLCVFAASCAKEHIVNESGSAVLYATLEPDTKTVLMEGGKVFWSPKDEIRLFRKAGEKGYRFVSTNVEAASSTEFSSVDMLGDLEMGIPVYAVYPYSQNTTFDGSKFSVRVPVTVKVNPGDISERFVSVARSSNRLFSFRNVLGGFRFSVSHEGVKRIIIAGNDSEKFIGDASFTLDNDGYPKMASSGTSSQLSITPVGDGCFKPGESYYVAVLPTEFSKGLRITYVREADKFVYSSDKPLTVRRSTLASLANLDAGLEPESSASKAAIGASCILPEGVDKGKITEARFYVTSSKTTDCLIQNGEGNIYFELEGTVANYYTAADMFELTDAVGMFVNWSSLNTVNMNMFDTSSVEDFTAMFGECKNLESVDLSSFETSNAKSMSSMFAGCESLKALDLSNFNTSNVTSTRMMFCNCFITERLNLLGLDFSAVTDKEYMFLNFSVYVDHARIFCTEEAIQFLSNGTEIDESCMIWTTSSDDYTSVDYSEDGKVRTLQKASVGKGINVVFVGDAYSDRQIRAGKYDKDADYAMETMFSVEPFKSFRKYFNVYSVTAVSQNETVDGKTAFDSRFGYGTYVVGNNNDALKYALKAVDESVVEDLVICVLVNETVYSGTCHMYFPSDGWKAVGSGLAIAYVPHILDSYRYENIFVHEVCGHGFAKLLDEYWYNENELTENDLESFRKEENSGWAANVDITGDVKEIKWKHFIEDSRYDSEKIGAYEGAMTFPKGVWRPTMMSIMTNGNMEFNAPCREAIYRRVNGLAFGEDWQYDYEEFVKFDMSIAEAAQSATKAPLARPASVSGRRVKHQPPVVIEKSWKEYFNK